MFRLRTVGLLCILFSFASFAGSRIDMSAGTTTAGGGAMLQYGSGDISQWSSKNFMVGLNTIWGFFLKKDFAVMFNVTMQGNLTSEGIHNYQLGTGLFYAFDMNGMLYPYVQALAYGKYEGITMQGNTSGGWSWGLAPSLGFLLGFNEHVALDFGLTSDVNFNINREGKTRLQLGAGYVGVKAFF